MENKTNILSGGPYYELSFILRKGEDIEFFIKDLLEKMSFLSFNFKDSKDSIINLLHEFIFKEEPLDLNTEIEVDIKRRSRVFIQIMSNELVLVDLWFLGSIFEDDPIIKSNKHYFRNLLNELFIKLEAVCATINYDSDCRDLFLTDSSLPDDRYNLSKLDYDTILNQLYNNKFEYAILGKEVTEKEIEYFFISDDDIEW